MEVINILADGMHSDNDENLQPQNTFRDSLNGTLVNMGGHKYAWTSVAGNTLSFSLPPHKANSAPFTIVGWKSTPGKLVVLSAAGSAANGPGEIGYVTFSNAGIGTYYPVYYHAELGFSTDYIFPFDGLIVKRENVNITRVYFTDNNKPFRAYNIIVEYLDPADPLILYDYYMALGDENGNSITADGIVRGPGETSGNLFQANNPGDLTWTSSGGGKLIKYTPIHNLDVAPKFAMGNIDFKQFNTDGSLTSGTYQYFYQLFTNDGTYSNFSFVTREILIAGTNNPAANSYSYQNYQGAIAAENSNKSITITISDIDSNPTTGINYQRIRVGYIHSPSFGVYNDPAIFYTGELDGQTSQDFTHYGSEVDILLSNDDLTSPVALLDLVKSITTTKNILFPANVGLANDPNYDMGPNGTNPITAAILPYFICGDNAKNITYANTIAAGYGVTGHEPTGDESSGNIIAVPGQWYEVIESDSGGTNKVTYNTNVYNATAGTGTIYFQAVLNPAVNQTITQGGTARAIAVFRIQKYTSPTTDTEASTPYYKNIRIINDYLDYKGTAASMYMKSLWREEVYRFGILLWHKQGFPLYVRHAIDVTMPAQYDSGYHLSDVATTDEQRLRILGVSLSNLDFTLVADELGVALADLDDHIAGFSIVRCPRDEQIIGQGLLYSTVHNGGTVIRPISATDPDKDDWYYNGGGATRRKENHYTWWCPDYLFSFDGRPSVGGGDKLVIQDYYIAANDGTYNQGEQIVSDHGTGTGCSMLYLKHYTQDNPAVSSILYDKGSEVSIVQESTLSADTNTVGLTIPGGSNTFDNTVGTDATNWFDVAGANIKQTGIGGRTMLVKTSDDETTYTEGFGYHASGALHKPLVNWKRPKATASLYGGTTEDAKANNQYMWINHYQPFDSAFMTHLVTNSGVIDNVEVFGGDCFVASFDIARIQRDHDVTKATSLALADIFPVESNINIAMREGRHFAKDRFSDADFGGTIEAPNGILYDTVATEGAIEPFNYLDAYSNIQSQLLYLSKPIGFSVQARAEKSIYFSLQKTDGEIIDNFKRILVNNFKNADGQYGTITNVRGKGTKVFYWQERGVGYMPVQERVTVGSELGQVVQLGVGGTLERQDELDYFFGNQHQSGLGETDTFFFWYDFINRAMLRMSFDGRKANFVEGNETLFANLFDNVETEASPSIFDSDNAFNGNGIWSVYDGDRELAYTIFKFNSTNAGTGRVTEQDVAMVFSKNIDKFLGKSSFTPGLAVYHDGYLLASKKARQIIVASESYAAGDEVYDSTATFEGTYVCILAYTDAGAAAKPNTLSSNWVRTSGTNEIFVSWRGSICKFFGIVYESYLDIIIKSDGTKIAVDSSEANGNNTPFSDVYVSNSSQSGSDLNIYTGNRNYRYYDGSWWFTLPRATNRGRLFDSWLRLKMRVKNYVTNPTIAIDAAKRIVSIKSKIRQKF